MMIHGTSLGNGTLALYLELCLVMHSNVEEDQKSGNEYAYDVNVSKHARRRHLSLPSIGLVSTYRASTILVPSGDSPASRNRNPFRAGTKHEL